MSYCNMNELMNANNIKVIVVFYRSLKKKRPIIEYRIDRKGENNYGDCSSRSLNYHINRVVLIGNWK